MRVFVAVELPPDVHKTLARIQDRLREQDCRGRWVPEDNFHITMKFLGEVREEQIPKIQQSLDTAALGVPQFSLKLGPLGSFRNGQVLFCKTDGAVETLEKLAYSVERELVPMGFKPEKRKFRAHITIARAVTGFSDYCEAADRSSIVKFKVMSFVLMESLQGGRGVRYVPLYHVPLVPNQ